MLRLLIILISLPPGVCFAEVSLGVEGGVTGSAYRASNQYWALPYLGYDNGRVYIAGTEGGLYFINNDHHELKVKAYYYPDEFVASDARTASLRKLSDRHSTLMSGISYMYTGTWGAIATSAAVDTLNNSKGVVTNVAYFAKEVRGNVTFVQEIGVEWSNSQQNRYYYGISTAESQRSGERQYRPGSDFTPYANVALDYLFTSRWETYAELSGKYLPSTVRNSPMVNKTISLALTVGVIYNF